MSKLDDALKGFARFNMRPNPWGYLYMSRSARGDYVKARRAAQEINRLRAEVERLRSERRMIVSHATMGGSDGVGMSVNDISCRVTALRNDLYNKGESEREPLRAEVKRLKELLDVQTSWVKASLSCAAHPWDPDQREAAEACCKDSMAALKGSDT